MGTVSWAASAPLKEDPGTTKQNTGWIVEVPEAKHMNWLHNKIDQFIHHMNDYGIPTWDAGTTYLLGSLTIASDLTLYKSTTASNTGNDPISSGTWVTVSDSQTQGATERAEEEFLTSGVWTRPSNMLGGWVKVILVAGGGGGNSNSSSGSGGGGAETVIRYIDVSSITLGTGTVTVTIGAGGAMNANGGDSTFGALLTSRGGKAPVITGIYGGASGGGVMGEEMSYMLGAMTTGRGGNGYTSEYGSPGAAGGGGWNYLTKQILGANGGSSFGGGGRGHKGLDNGAGGGGGSWGSGGSSAQGAGSPPSQNAGANTGGGGAAAGTGGSGYCKVIWEE